MLVVATGRSQLPVARGHSQEKSDASCCLHPQSLSPPLFLHPSSPPLSFVFHCHPSTKPVTGRMQVMGVWCSQCLAWPRGSGWSMGRTEDPSQLCPRAEFSLWVQFRPPERDFAVGSQAPGWVQMAKTQKWELGWRRSWDGARMGMEPLRGPRAPARPAQPGTCVGTEGTVTLPHPGVTAETEGTLLSSRLGLSFPDTSPSQHAGRRGGEATVQPWVALNQDLHHVRQVQGSGSG